MACEFIASCAANAVGNITTEYASPYVSYFFQFGKIVEEFKNRRKELELKSDQVKNDVNNAVSQTEVIEKAVRDWLIRAEKELVETQTLEAEIERNKCFNWCPSWGWRYCLSRKVAKRTISINKLLESCNFSRVGHRRPPEGIEFFPSKDFMPNESSNFTFNEIIKALNTDGVNMIGLYGMPGVGKTTLAKEVGRHAKEQKLFDKVVMATMSQTPNINKIQDKIAELLGLKFEVSTDEGKAEELWRRLQGVEKILVIIDDVWNEFKLHTVGIPFGVHGGCKILLTTRLRQVCVRMNCQQEFQLDILSKDEAWALFKDTAGLKDVSSRLNDVAKEVARECKGLPLAIVTIGKALKGASLDGWKAANKRLKDSRHLDNEEVSQGIYNCLKLSYDYLKGDNIRTCFLLCSLFPEDWDIEIEELVMFAIGYGLFSHINLIEDLRREIREALRKLQESGLLLGNDDDDDDDDDERYVRMHDVVRDFAHWITSTGKNIFMVKEGLMEWPLRESCGSHTAISFWNSNINIFPEKLEFPELKILIFAGKTLVKVPIAFVEGMKALRVLHLQDVILSLEVLEVVTNLRTLCLVNCELENITPLGNLKNLEILAFCDTNIYELPEELAALRGLKSLHFFSSGNEQINFPPNLLSRLTSLQELHVTCENNVNLPGLNSLSRLTGLSLRVSTAQCFPENLVFPELQSYNIAVNEDLRFMQELNSRTLEITKFSSSLSAFEKLLCNVEKLALKNVMGHKNIVPNIDPKGLGKLTSLWLQKCDYMECLVDTTGEKGPTAFSDLVKLRMRKMTWLKELCHGPPPISFLQKLKDVTIEHCTRLKVVFEMDGLLEKEEISQMPLLSNLTSLNLSFLPELESIWKSQSIHQYHASLRSLKVVNISWCDELKAIFPPCLAQSLLHLQELEIFECDRLEQVFDFPQEVGELEVRPLFNLTSLELKSLPELKWIWKGPTHLVNLQSLKTMIIWGCEQLAYLFSTPLARSLEHLEVLVVSYCDSLEHVIFDEAEKEDQIVSNMNGYPLRWPKLRTLKIINCGRLKYVFPITLAQGLPYLVSVEITGCAKLAYLFSTPLAQSLEHLEVLEISHCDSLEHVIFDEAENEDQIVSNMDGYPLRWPKLRTLKIINCGRLKYVFPITLAQGLPYLESVEITDCSQLKQVFNMTEDKGGRPLQDIVLQRLQILRLKNLEKLSSFCPENFVMSLSLKAFEVCNCPQLTEFKTLQAHLKDVPSYGFKELLCNVKELTMDGFMYHNLKHLFSPSLVQSLVMLETLKIERCDELEHIATELEIDNNVEPDSGLLHHPPLPKLTSLEIDGHIRFLQKLKDLTIADCKRLKVVFEMDGLLEKEEISQTPLLSNLKSLNLSSLPELESIWKSQSIHQYHASLRSLKVVNISWCDELKAIFPPCLAQSLLHLQELSIYDCNGLEQIIDFPQEMGELQVRPLSNLTSLELKSLPELKWIWKGPTHLVNLQSLKTMIIWGCKQLAYLFSTPLARSLEHLEVLVVSHCDSLEHLIFDEAENEDEIVSNMNGYPLRWPKLRTLKIINCGRLKYVFPITLAQGLPYLESVEITDCSQLKQVFNMTEDKGGRPLQDIVLQRLQILRLKNLEKLSSFCLENFVISLSLKAFEVCNCPQLTEFTTLQAHLKDVPSYGFKELLCNVKELTMDGFMYHNLKHLFSPSLVQSLVMLEKLKIELCDELEHIATELEIDNNVESDGGLLHHPPWPKLTSLEIHGHIRSLQKLKDLTIRSCKRLKVVFEMDGLLGKEEISQTPLLSNLTSLDLSSLPELESIWKSQSTHQYHASLRSLKVVNISRCGELKAIFPPCLAQSLLHLKNLSICYCYGLEQIIDFPQEMGELQVRPLSNLTSLELKSLPELKWIWKGPTHLVNLQSLKTMIIWRCEQLAYLFSTPLARSLEHLGVLEISHCDSLEHLIFDEAENEDQIVSNMNGYPLRWPKLRTLKIINCGRLKYVFPITLAQGLPYLVSVEINGCAKLAYLFSTPLAQSLEHLRVLEISHCDSLEHLIFDEAENEDQIVSNMDGYPLRWPKLRTLKIINCGRLKYVFPITLAQGLPYLESVEINYCSQLKQVFNMTEDKGGRPLQDIVLQRLQILRLKYLEKLSSFCPENFVMSLSLKEFEVSSCPQLTEFKTLQANLKDFKELLCNVRILTMDGIMYHKNLIPSVDPQGLNELTFLTLRDDKALECLIDTTDQGHVSTVPLLPNLTSLKLKSLPELKWIWKGPSHHVCLQSLEVAVISRCNKLKYLFSQSLVQSLVMLEQLKIEYCDELEHIATELEIDDNIKSDSGFLHSPPLPKLTSLEIHGCPRLQYVFNVAKENNGVDNAILPPSLEKLTIVVCPRFAKFIIQQVVHKRLQLKELRCSELEQDNLCDTINWENIFQIQDGHLLLRIEILNLEGIHQLQGPIQVASLPCLKNLKVSNCNELKSLFSSLLARNLPQLKILNIEYCEKLEEIIEMDQTSIASSSQGHLQTISFPSLQDIRISGCSNLKSLFPISVTPSFANLVSIEITGPSKLEQVFGYQGELDIEDDQKGIVLPQLREVTLFELSDLKSFAPTGCHFRFPSMWSFKITKSPKLTTSVIMDSKHPVPAITEEPQQVQNNTTEGFTTMEEIVDNQTTYNDIIWSIWEDQVPQYMTVGETRITLHKEVKNSGETC